jgi:rhamnogalacturonyl hydrolase YesR
MALVDLLSPPLPIPATHPTHGIVLKQLRSLLLALAANANPRTGVWSLVMSQPSTRKGNYIETSGSLMFVYAILKAVRLGFVADEDHALVNTARKAYEYIVKEHISWNRDGTISLTNTVRVGSLE